MRRKSKVWRICAMALAGMLVFTGCGGKQGQQKVEQLTEKPVQSVSLEEIDLDSLDLSVGVWKDNSLDKYSATNNYELKSYYPAGAKEGGATAQFVANTRAYRMKKHLLMESAKSWDEVSFVTTDGTHGSEAFTLRTSQVWMIGAVAGTDDCLLEMITWQEEGGCLGHHILVADKEMKTKQAIHLAFLDGEEYILFDKMMMDAMGNLHLIYDGKYIITDNSGTIISEYLFEGSYEHLYLMKDGQVALKVHDSVKSGKATLYSFLHYDMTRKEWIKLAEIETGIGVFMRVAVCPDKDTILFANREGVYKASTDNLEGATLLYKWINHGLMVTDVYDLQYLEGDRISLICEEGDKKYYLNLEPTKEEVPVQMITFAVPAYRKAEYEKAVAAFNKQYPAYQIVLRTDYDQTALLTELMAGKGPVLIDTYLTGFAEQKELWLPMDKILEKLELTDELLLPAMEQGKIDGQLYGVVRDFSIDTVITVGAEPRNWDYEEMVKEILENQKLEALTDSKGCEEGWAFVTRFLMHGLEDNFFIDSETGTTRFREPQMKELFESVREYYNGTERYEAGKLLEEGKVLCNPVSISRPEQLALYRMYYGERLQYSGYPTKNGGKHFLNSSQPITVRRNASKEEITVACLFFHLMLSYDVQAEGLTNRNMFFSVRKDVLEEQLAAVNKDTYADAYTISGDPIQLGDAVDHEMDRETFYHLLENASPEKYLTEGLGSIFVEELTGYFDGEISVDMVLEHLENRVQLYLDEN